MFLADEDKAIVRGIEPPVGVARAGARRERSWRAARVKAI
jgi:hypothetical protein